MIMKTKQLEVVHMAIYGKYNVNVTRKFCIEKCSFDQLSKQQMKLAMGGGNLKKICHQILYNFMNLVWKDVR